LSVIDFIDFNIWDLLDILIVGYLFFIVYRLLRGSIAFNIFIGIGLLYLLSWVVKALKMDLLSMILGQFVNIGFIIIVIIFQPEVRKFLLYLGNSTMKGRMTFFNKILGVEWLTKDVQSDIQQDIQSVLLRLSASYTGALIIIDYDNNLANMINSGVKIDAHISQNLLLSIFNKESPLHDGAVIISNHRIVAASCVLPLSERSDLPAEIGLRHRAAIGISEVSNILAFIVSEENGRISVAYQGKFYNNLDEAALGQYIAKIIF
jgi:diadenylate cyclase